MANRINKLSQLFADQKTRTMLILTGILLVSMIIWGFVSLNNSDTSESSKSSIAAVPDIESVPNPNQPLSPQMTQNIRVSDEQRITSAQQSGKSALPTLLPQAQNAQMFIPGNTATGVGSGVGSKVATNNTQQQDALTNAQLAALNTELSKSQQALANSQAELTQQYLQAQQKALQVAEKQQQDMANSMQNQAQALLTAWTSGDGNFVQSFVEGELAQAKLEPNTSVPDSRGVTAAASEPTAATPQNKSPAAIKAGDIMFGILNTEVNSDEPGPILATIVSGNYRGSKLVGSIQKSPEIKGTNGPSSVILTFNSMSIKSFPSSISVNVIAIDPDTARTALASSVDHHRLYRYGTLFASSFLAGYGNAISQSGSVVFDNTDGSQTTFQQELNPTETFLAALGQVGTELGNKLSDAIDRPNTIMVNSGVSLGLLFLNDVTIDTTIG